MGMVRSSRRSATTRFEFLESFFIDILCGGTLGTRSIRHSGRLNPQGAPSCASSRYPRASRLNPSPRRRRPCPRGEFHSLRSTSPLIPVSGLPTAAPSFRLRLPRLRLPHLPRRILILLRVVERGRRVERQRPRRPRRFPLARRRRQLVKASFPSHGPSRRSLPGSSRRSATRRSPSCTSGMTSRASPPTSRRTARRTGGCTRSGARRRPARTPRRRACIGRGRRPRVRRSRPSPRRKAWGPRRRRTASSSSLSAVVARPWPHQHPRCTSTGGTGPGAGVVVSPSNDDAALRRLNGPLTLDAPAVDALGGVIVSLASRVVLAHARQRLARRRRGLARALGGQRREGHAPRGRI